MSKLTDCYITIGAHRGGTEGGVLGEGQGGIIKILTVFRLILEKKIGACGGRKKRKKSTFFWTPPNHTYEGTLPELIRPPKMAISLKY